MTGSDSVTNSSTSSKPVRIGDLLVARGMVTDDQINHALAFQKENDCEYGL